MSVKKYTKKPVQYIPYEEYFADESIKVTREKKPRITLWDLIFGSLSDIHELLINSKIAGITIPVILIALGISIIFRQTWPDLIQYVKTKADYYNNDTVALVEGDYVTRPEYLSDPGAGYFRQLTEEANETRVLLADAISAEYSNRFSLSIDSLGLADIPVSPNVNSGVEEVYDQVLTDGLAHFAGTSLPISDVDQNFVVYGHSSREGYYDRTHDPAGAFSRLSNIKVGDEVKVKMDGQEYTYRITKSKIVEPEDVSIVTGDPGKKTITLFTCFPDANSRHRFVAIGKPIN